MNVCFQVRCVLAALVSVVACSGVALSSEPAATRVATNLADWNKPDAPGLVWAVVAEGKVIGTGAFGLADLKQRTPITLATRFNIGSMSKQFTALAVSELAAQRKLSLDDDIHRCVPELPDFGAKITLRQLLHHTSGIQDWDQLIHLAGTRLEDPITHAEVLRLICARKQLNFAPGEKFGYTNSGYSLLATVVERTTHDSFAAWMRAHVFRPLRLEEMCVQDGADVIIPQRAESYVTAGEGKFRHIPDSTAILGASSIYCSMEEFIKYLQAFDDPRRAERVRFLTEQDVFNSGESNPYACGLQIGRYKGLSTLSHEGGWAGFHTFMLRFPEKKLGIALFSNHGSIEPGALVSQIADIYLGLEAIQPPPSVRREIALDAATLDRYVGDYALSPSLIISIVRDGNHLTSEATGHARERMFAESNATFFFKVENSTITFVSDEKGAVSHLIVNRQGRSMEARRIVFPRLSNETLGEYAGDYSNDELGSHFVVQRKDDHLVLSHLRHGEIPLTPTAVDCFSGNEWWVGRVLFKRDTRNHAISFEVPGSRIKPVVFLRKAG